MADPSEPATEPNGGGGPEEVTPTEASVDDAFAAVEEALLIDGFDADVEPLDLTDGSVAASEAADPLQVERDSYRDALQRVKAEFDNYRKRTDRAQVEIRERAAEQLVSQLLPVLDACDAAVLHDSVDVGPISKMLLETLQKEGLEPMVAEGAPFDPTMHEAVAHEAGDGGESIVTESLRTGYLWKGRVLRPAMVKVRG